MPFEPPPECIGSPIVAEACHRSIWAILQGYRKLQGPLDRFRTSLGSFKLQGLGGQSLDLQPSSLDRN
ncbi:hypothetical protein RHGRI_032644 [Rhododendron griersonianum]|uniref:Uncharacterized protein n=1 Tax=Rhododendron griersonianum TaxID=479676 RepID=A0AAV6IIE9_9ERIC|nr:hypothetical protein RHGRI_032644 [Rhododendron griersonianum]